MDEPLMELSTMEMSPTVQLYSPTPPSQRMSNCMDRFVPSRSNSKWQTNFSMIGENSRSARRLFRKSINNEPTRDQSAYSCLLRNELLGDQIEDVQANSVKRRVLSTVTNNLFRYTSPSKEQTLIHHKSPYSLSPLSAKSQKLLCSPPRNHQQKKISTSPIRVLEAPELQNDYYLNLLDWSSQNILSVALKSCVYLWSANTKEVTKVCDVEANCCWNHVTSVAWNTRGNLLAVGTHFGTIQIWDVTAKKLLNTIRGHKARVGTLAWNGDVLSSGSRDRLILQRDVRTPNVINERRLEAHRQEVCGLKWSPSNQYLASGGNDNSVFIWDQHSLSPVQTFLGHTAAVKALAWSPHHHSLLATGGGTADKCIRIWDTLIGQCKHKVDTGSQVCNLTWSKFSCELLSTHGFPQNQICVWNYPSLRETARIFGHSYRVLYMALSPDGETIVTGSGGDATLRFWNVFNKTYKENNSVLNLATNIR